MRTLSANIRAQATDCNMTKWVPVALSSATISSQCPKRANTDWLSLREDEMSSVPERAKNQAALASFLTRTLELRPLESYFSRRPGGKSSGVPSLKPALD